jgi:uncharacterized protein YneF (UPF0154 family)
MKIKNKKTIALMSLALVAVFVVGLCAGVWLTPKTVTTTVQEAITVTPNSVSITMYEGETKYAVFCINNAADVDVTLTVNVQCMNTSYANFFTLNYTSPFTAKASTSDQQYKVGITANQSIPVGIYNFTLSFER